VSEKKQPTHPHKPILDEFDEEKSRAKTERLDRVQAGIDRHELQNLSQRVTTLEARTGRIDTTVHEHGRLITKMQNAIDALGKIVRKLFKATAE
jgi:archaellum component FlaC